MKKKINHFAFSLKVVKGICMLYVMIFRTICIVSFYVPNFEKVEGAFCFGLVPVSVSPFKKR